MVFHADSFSGHLSPLSPTIQWYAELLVLSITNLLQKLGVAKVKYLTALTFMCGVYPLCLVILSSMVSCCVGSPKGNIMKGFDNFFTDS